MEPLKIGILGMGNEGRMFARRILAGECPEVELVAVCDHNPAQLAFVEENYPNLVRFATKEEMYDSGLCEGIIIAVPHYDHPGFAMEIMRRGLHVMVEKPAGVYTKQVREMNEEAKKHDVVFGMMFNQRTNCVYRKMRELVQSGKYGNIRRTNWLITNWYRPQAYYDSGDWRATWSGEGGGVLMNQCPHQLDLWQWICGMPVKVQTQMHFGKWHDIEVDDDVTTYVEYANGATGVFITSTGDACGSNRFEIQMDKAKLIAEGDKLTVIELDVAEPEFTKTNTAPFGSPKKQEIDPELDGQNRQHMGVLSAWAKAVRLGEPLVAGGEEGIHGLTLANAMYLSAWKGQTITLPFDEDEYYEELMKRVATSRRKTNVVAQTADTAGTFAGTK